MMVLSVLLFAAAVHIFSDLHMIELSSMNVSKDDIVIMFGQWLASYQEENANPAIVDGQIRAVAKVILCISIVLMLSGSYLLYRNLQNSKACQKNTEL
jgi:hypothetical protein